MTMTRNQFKRKAERLFLKQNPTATVEWIYAKFVTYPTGVKGWSGRFTATAPGYRPSVMLAHGDDSYIMVR